MKSLESEYPLLGNTGSPDRHPQPRGTPTRAYIIIFCLALSNLVLLIWPQLRPHTPIVETSKFANLSFNTPVKYELWTDYQSPNATERDSRWWDFDMTPIEVMYSDEEAAALDLPISKMRFPWDESKGIYFLKAFHDIHCLKVIHRTLRQLQLHPGAPSDETIVHAYHCLDALRQDVMCAADDTPMPMTKLPEEIGEAQVRTCRNWEDLISWTRGSERHPCYRRAGYPPRNATVEYLWCGEDSPYREEQQAYFDEYGHLYSDELRELGWYDDIQARQERRLE